MDGPPFKVLAVLSVLVSLPHFFGQDTVEIVWLDANADILLSNDNGTIKS